MPRGGARVGSGPKLKATVLPGGFSDDALAIPPADLPDAQRDFWRDYAPSAMAAGTLTVQSLASWRLLCEIDARRRKLLAQLDKEGETYITYKPDPDGGMHEELKKHPLSSEYRGLAQRTESMMSRFGLAPFGKPIGTGRPNKKTVTSPWAQVAGFGK